MLLIRALVLVWLGLAVRTTVRARSWAPAAVAALAWGVRVALPDHVLMGVAYPYVRLRIAAGTIRQALYGDGFAAIVGWLHPWLLDLHDTQRILDAGTAALLWVAGRHWFGSWGGWAAGLGWALLPVAVAAGRSEVMFVAGTLLLVSAAAGLADGDEGGLVLAGLAAGLAAHVRPGLLPLTALVVVVLLARRAWPGAAVGTALGAWRALTLASLPTVPAGFVDGWAQGLWPQWVGPGAAVMALDPLVVPVAVPALAAVGLAGAVDRRAATGLVLAFGIGTLTFVHLGRPTDVWRMQLPATAALVLLAGAGAASVARQGRAWIAVVAAGVAVSWWLARSPWGPETPWQAEYRLLREVMTAVDRPVVVVGSPGGGAHPSHWVTETTGVPWTVYGTGTPLPPGTLLWRSRVTAWAPRDVTARSRRTAAPWPPGVGVRAVDVLDVPAVTHPVERYDQDPVVLGLYEVTR